MLKMVSFDSDAYFCTMDQWMEESSYHDVDQHHTHRRESLKAHILLTCFHLSLLQRFSNCGAPPGGGARLVLWGGEILLRGTYIL
jgi:hypothetical protein